MVMNECFVAGNHFNYCSYCNLKTTARRRITVKTDNVDFTHTCICIIVIIIIS